jgi:hypothetical protein
MRKSILSAVLALTGVLAAGAAHAGGISWSIGIGTPIIGVVGNAPAYAPVPVYAPAPVYVGRVPDYRAYAPVVVAPRVVYGRPYPVAYGHWRAWERNEHRGWERHAHRGWHRD